MESKPTQLPHLETFVEAAELGSFTKAALALGLTQAAVSQRIGALEKMLRQALFQRRGGRVHLTEAGKKLHDFAQRILALHQEARGALTGAPTGITGELILAASSVPGEHLLPRLLTDFRSRFGGIQVKATVQDSQAVLDLLEQGKAHLGLVGRKGDSPHLTFRSIGCDEMVLVTAPGTKLARGSNLDLGQLKQIPLILREKGSGSRWCLEQALAREGLRLGDLTVALELGSNEAIKEAVIQGLGGAVLSTRVVRKEIKARRLKAVAVSGLCLERRIYVAWNQRRVLPSAAQHFLHFLEDAADVPFKA